MDKDSLFCFLYGGYRGNTFDYTVLDDTRIYIEPTFDPIPPSNLILNLIKKVAPNGQVVQQTSRRQKAKPFPSSRKRWENG